MAPGAGEAREILGAAQALVSEWAEEGLETWERVATEAAAPETAPGQGPPPRSAAANDR